MLLILNTEERKEKQRGKASLNIYSAFNTQSALHNREKNKLLSCKMQNEKC